MVFVGVDFQLADRLHAGRPGSCGQLGIFGIQAFQPGSEPGSVVGQVAPLVECLDEVDATSMTLADLVMPAVVAVELVEQHLELGQENVGVAVMEVEVDRSEGRLVAAKDAVDLAAGDVGLDLVGREPFRAGLPAVVVPPQVFRLRGGRREEPEIDQGRLAAGSEANFPGLVLSVQLRLAGFVTVLPFDDRRGRLPFEQLPASLGPLPFCHEAG
ncbi:MAG TPA: hypothetical protein VMV10_00025, partial [Pirellulales bacterium]|nr:hypothetical protein [Pirellulales bacterium]